MDKQLRESLLSVCKILSKHKVEYLIVGGTAVALHGYFRVSITFEGTLATKPDLDFWYNPSYNNYFSLLNVIEELGQDVSEFKNETTPDPEKSFFKLNFDAFTIDFLPELPGLSRFKDSYGAKEVEDIDGVEVIFISFDDLITNKQALLRKKDTIDIEELQKRKGNSDKG